MNAIVAQADQPVTAALGVSRAYPQRATVLDEVFGGRHSRRGCPLEVAKECPGVMMPGSSVEVREIASP
jgi:hypothetical protein